MSKDQRKKKRTKKRTPRKLKWLEDEPEVREKKGKLCGKINLYGVNFLANAQSKCVGCAHLHKT